MNSGYSDEKFKEAVLAELKSRGTLQTDDDLVTGVHGVVNEKDVKYADKLLDKYDDGNQSFEAEQWLTESTQVVRMDADRLKRLFKLMKASQSDSVAFVVTDEAPLVSLFIRNNNPQGVYLQAPKIHSDDWSGWGEKA